MKEKIVLRVNLDGGDAKRFKRLKALLGLSQNTEVVRFLINKAFKEMGRG